jgi:hypothetical protein
MLQSPSNKVKRRNYQSEKLREREKKSRIVKRENSADAKLPINSSSR